MNRRLALTAALSIGLAATLHPASAADDKGFIGIGIAVDADGFFNPTVNAVTVSKVTPGSPAAAQGIAIGDTVVEYEGVVVKGRKARELEPLMQRPVGKTVKMRLKRPNGELYDVALVAVRKPE